MFKTEEKIEVCLPVSNASQVGCRLKILVSGEPGKRSFSGTGSWRVNGKERNGESEQFCEPGNKEIVAWGRYGQGKFNLGRVERNTRDNIINFLISYVYFFNFI